MVLSVFGKFCVIRARVCAYKCARAKWSLQNADILQLAGRFICGNLLLSEKSSIFVYDLKEMTVFEHIGRLKEAGFWRAELSMYHRATTLDFYYRLYALIRELAPERGYGYLHRLLKK